MRKNAFTLAETLITLGIIGIVAAILIPMAVDNYEKKQVPLRLKKMYNTLWNAIGMAEAENGPTDNWEFENDAAAKDFYITQIQSRMNCAYKSGNENVNCHFSDGSIILYSVFRSYGLLELEFIPFASKKALRYNNNLEENTSRRYRFGYGVRLNYEPTRKWPPKTETTVMNINVKTQTRDQLLNKGPYGNGTFSCKRNDNRSCIHVIKMDGWKIEKDYPW